MNFVQNGNLTKSGVHYFDSSLNPRRALRILNRNMGKEEELLKIVHNNDEKKLQVNTDPEVGGPDHSVNRLLIVCNEQISVYVKLIFFQFF